MKVHHFRKMRRLERLIFVEPIPFVGRTDGEIVPARGPKNFGLNLLIFVMID